MPSDTWYKNFIAEHYLVQIGELKTALQRISRLKRRRGHWGDEDTARRAREIARDALARLEPE